jgi:DNA-binding IclR family transcriptional regulator
VEALDRALLALEALADAPAGLGVSELGRKLGIDKSTAHRLLATLQARGFVRLNGHTQRYALGLRLAALGAAAVQGVEITDVARPYLEELRDRTREAAHLAVLSEGEVMFLSKAAGPGALTVNAGVGTRMPAHCTALGKVLLAGLLEQERPDAIERAVARHGLARHTLRTIVEAGDLERHLAHVAAQGWALDDEEYAVGLRALAAPVRDAEGQVVAAVSVSGPSGRITLDAVDALAAHVQRGGESVSAALGYRPPTQTLA